MRHAGTVRRASGLRRALPALLLCAATACGTTLQVAPGRVGPSTGAASEQGLSLPPTVAAPAATTSSQSAATGSRGSVAPGGGELTAPTSATTSAQASTPGAPSRTSGSTGPTVSSGPAAGSPVTIGFFVAKDLGQAFKSLGYSGLSTGDGAQEVRAAVKLVNSMGGLAGHPIKPVIVETSVSTNGVSDTTFQQTCSTWFDDNHATAAVTVEYSTILGSCAQQHQAPLIYASLSDSLSQPMLHTAATTVITDMPTIEVDAAALTDSLLHHGFFSGSGLIGKPVIGLVTSDEPAYADAKAIVTKHLTAAGLSLKDTFAMPQAGDVTAAVAAGESAALRFKADGINRVIFVSGSFGASWFGVAARLDAYYPRLGWGSMEEPSLEPQVMSAQQLQGAAGIGWDPTLDTTPQYQPTLGTHGAACAKALHDGGIDMSVAATRVVALPVCDATLLLAAGAASGGITGPDLLSGIEGLGTSYSSVMNFATDFRSRAATAAARPIAYSSGCGCFRYAGPTEPLK